MTATVVQSVAGAPTQYQFQVVSKLTGSTSVRLKVGTNLALTTGVFFVPAQVADGMGYVRHTAANLTPGTQYFYQLADNPGVEVLVGPVGMCKTLPPAGSPQNFTVALVSCVTQAATDTSAMNDWAAWNASLNIFTGDQNYSGTTSTVLATQVGTYETQIAAAGSGDATASAAGYGSSYAMMHGRSWGYYCRSDHEAGPDNGDSNNSYTATSIAAAQQVFPFGTLGDTVNSPVHGLYQSWVIGRVRFIMLDIRNTDRSPGANTDDSSKTMLGAGQLAWLKQQLIAPEPLKVIISDVQWLGAATGFLLTNGPDKWWSYSTERSAIVSFIAANQAQVGSVMLWHGDCHALATCTAANNTSWGGFPVYGAAPMHNTGGGLALGTFSQSWNNSAGNVRGYGRITITDDGYTITSKFQGWDAVGQVAQVTQTDTFSCPPVQPAAGGTFPGMTA